MLHDPRKDPLSIRFADWLRTKPSEEGYNWSVVSECACGQFQREVGVRLEEAGELWGKFNTIAQRRPRTFGALLARVLQQV